MKQFKVPCTGIDVSYAQGKIDWEKLKKDDFVNYAIIRATASYPTANRKAVDLEWERNIRAAEKTGLPIGVYHYSYASNVQEARLEAAHFLKTIKGHKFEMPVVFDFEEPFQIGGTNQKTGQYINPMPLSKQFAIIDAFMEEVEKAGYFAMLYSTASALQALYNYSPERLLKYSIWVAHVNVNKPQVSFNHGIWQYSWKGHVSGIPTEVDLNNCYINYPEIIKSTGLNGFSKDATENPDTENTDLETKYNQLKEEYDTLKAEHDALLYDMQALVNAYS